MWLKILHSGEGLVTEISCAHHIPALRCIQSLTLGKLLSFPEHSFPQLPSEVSSSSPIEWLNNLPSSEYKAWLFSTIVVVINTVAILQSRPRERVMAFIWDRASCAGL